MLYSELSKYLLQWLPLEIETFMITLHKKLQFPMTIYSVALSLCYHNLVSLDSLTYFSNEPWHLM